jgi:prophage maintenance system killer protein
MDSKGEIILYQTPDGQTALDVKLDNETVWLTQAQMAELFQTTPQNVTLHIGNIYKEIELEQIATCKDYLQVRQEGKRQVKRNVAIYNLDVIISVGYRVKSTSGTQFRIWANKILRDYLIKGYAINQKIQNQQLEDLKGTIKLLSNVVQNNDLQTNEAAGLIKVVADYAYGLDVLDKYDHEQLTIENVSTKEYFKITYENAMRAIHALKEKFGGSSLFGNEKDESFKSSLGAIYQTFDSKEMYPSIEEKAANFLYFVIKNHSFSDGNKRIAAFLFIWFLEENKLLYRADGSKRIGDNALVALTLMIAESKPDEKDIMVKVVVNLINGKNE